MNPSLYCSLHQRPVNQEMSWSKEQRLIQKAGKLRRWWTRVPKSHLAQVGLQASFVCVCVCVCVIKFY